MKKIVIAVFCLCLVSLFGSVELRADVTVETTSSFSGIPFLRMFEMDQALCVRGSEMITLTEGEIGLGDTSTIFRSSMYFNFKDQIIRMCDWRDSLCNEIDISELEEMLDSGLEDTIIDSIMPYLEMVSQYVSFDKAEMTETGTVKKVSGYKCKELALNINGQVSPPIDKLSGNFRFKINGSYWVTDDFSRADEYKKAMAVYGKGFLTPPIERVIEKIMTALNLDKSLIDKYFELFQYLFVEAAINIVVEMWSEGMDVPSMSFNIRFNSVLENLSFDKIPEAVFEPPPGLEYNRLDFRDIIK